MNCASVCNLICLGIHFSQNQVGVSLIVGKVITVIEVAV